MDVVIQGIFTAQIVLTHNITVQPLQHSFAHIVFVMCFSNGRYGVGLSGAKIPMGLLSDSIVSNVSLPFDRSGHIVLNIKIKPVIAGVAVKIGSLSECLNQVLFFGRECRIEFLIS